MTGLDIVDALQRAYPELTTIVPPDRMKGGALPDGITLPALLLRTISSVESQPLKRGETVRVTDRVAVTVRAGSYREQRSIMALVKSCSRGRTGAIGGAMRVSILTAGTGPDLRGPADSYEQTQDFRVSFDDAA